MTWRGNTVATRLPTLPGGTGCVGLGVEDLEIDGVFHQVQAIAVLAFEGAGAELVGAVVVVHRTSPQLLELGAQRALEIRAEKCGDQLGVEFAHVAAEFLAADLGETQHVFRKAGPAIGADVEGDLELAAARRHHAAARGQGQGAEIFLRGPGHRPAEIGERAGRWDLHHVARPHAVDIEGARGAERVPLPFGDAVQRDPRLAGRAAAGHELGRRMRQVLGEVRKSRQHAERRVLLLVGLDVFRVVDRQLGDVVEALDVARLDPGLFPQPLIERVLPADLHDLEEALVLQGADAVRRPLVDGVDENVGHRIALIERIPVHRLVIDRQAGLHGFCVLCACAASACLTLSCRRSAAMAFLWKIFSMTPSLMPSICNSSRHCPVDQPG